MSELQPTAPEQPAPSTQPRWRTTLVALLPHMLTVLVAVALALSIQRGLTTPSPEFVPPVRPTVVSTSTTADATPSESPSESLPTALPQPDERVLSQEILDLRARLDEVWSSVYLARTAGQLADAEVALRSNDTLEVERVLVAVDASLALAYERSGQLNKGPIGEFRSQVGQIRDDLHVRPEGLDRRLRSLRQNMLALVEEP